MWLKVNAPVSSIWSFNWSLRLPFSSSRPSTGLEISRRHSVCCCWIETALTNNCTLWRHTCFWTSFLFCLFLLYSKSKCYKPVPRHLFSIQMVRPKCPFQIGTFCLRDVIGGSKTSSPEYRPRNARCQNLISLTQFFSFGFLIDPPIFDFHRSTYVQTHTQLLPQ